MGVGVGLWEHVPPGGMAMPLPRAARALPQFIMEDLLGLWDCIIVEGLVCALSGCALQASVFKKFDPSNLFQISCSGTLRPHHTCCAVRALPLPPFPVFLLLPRTLFAPNPRPAQRTSHALTRWYGLSHACRLRVQFVLRSIWRPYLESRSRSVFRLPTHAHTSPCALALPCVLWAPPPQMPLRGFSWRFSWASSCCKT
jgi:hypothetical protein